MTVRSEIGRLARSLGIVAIFAVVGPLAVTAMLGTLVLAIGAPMLVTLLEFVDLGAFRSWLSVAAFLLVFFAVVAAAVPSLVAGLGFAISAVYCGRNSLWAALAIVGVVVIGVVALGFFVSAPEAGPLLLPGVKGLRQAAFLAMFLSVPAAAAASLSWLFSRPLHRTP